jgi:hypothetical protein
MWAGKEEFTQFLTGASGHRTLKVGFDLGYMLAVADPAP